MRFRVTTSSYTSLIFIPQFCFFQNLKSFPSTLKYNIRLPGEHHTIKTLDIIWNNWHTSHLFSSFPLTSVRVNTSDDGSPSKYYEEGFLLVQSLIFEGLMKALNKSSIEMIPKIYVQVCGIICLV